jgi:hypothetical protein
MNNERYNQIIDEAYENYWSNAKHNNSDCLIKQEEGSLLVEMRFYYKQEFINKCKTDPEFSKRWGLKIEERELSFIERLKISGIEIDNQMSFVDYTSILNAHNIPTKLITVTYKKEKIEIYG